MFENSFSNQESPEEFLYEQDRSYPFTHLVHDALYAQASCSTDKFQVLLLELIRVHVGHSLTFWYFHLDCTFCPMQEKTIVLGHGGPLCANYCIDHVSFLQLIVQFEIVSVVLDCRLP